MPPAASGPRHQASVAFASLETARQNLGSRWQVGVAHAWVARRPAGSVVARHGHSARTNQLGMPHCWPGAQLNVCGPVFLTLVRLVHLVPHLLCHLFAAHYTLPHVFYLAPSLAAAGMHPHPSAFVAFGFQLRRFQGVTIITKKWYDEQIALLASGAAD